MEEGVYTIYASSEDSTKKAVTTNVVVERNASVTAEDLKLTATGNITGIPAINFTTSEITSRYTNGKDGTSMKWLGSFASEEEIKEPKYLDAYYNTADGCSYIYDGEKWNLLAKGNAEIQDEHSHTPSDEWSGNSDFQWHVATCEHTDQLIGFEPHDDVIIEMLKSPGCRDLCWLDLSSFDISNVTDVSYMFLGCYRLQKLFIDLSKMGDVSRKNMFGECNELLDVQPSRD